jgi:hypothetical protein
VQKTVGEHALYGLLLFKMERHAHSLRVMQKAGYAFAFFAKNKSLSDFELAGAICEKS